MKPWQVVSLAVTVAGLGTSPLLIVQQPPAQKRPPVKLPAEARNPHAEALVIDGQNDLPYRLRDKNEPFGKNLDIAKPQPTLHTDIARLRQGNVGAQFWSAYVAAET